MIDPQQNGGKRISLKVLREERGLSQEQLAKRLGTSLVSLRAWERTGRIPRFDNAVALASALGVSLKTLAIALGLDVSGIPDDKPAD